MEISIILISKINKSNIEEESKRLIRSIKSFISQDISNKKCELIIISHGCEITNKIYKNYFQNYTNIRLLTFNSNLNTNNLYLNAISYTNGSLITHLNNNLLLKPGILSHISNIDKDWDYMIDKEIYIPFDFNFDNLENEELINNQDILFKKTKNYFYNLNSVIYTKNIGNKYWKESNNINDFINNLTQNITNTYSLGMHCICYDQNLNINV